MNAAGESRPPTRRSHAGDEDRPTAAYGSRVHRRLRGRWFELVPVKQSTLIAVTATILIVTAGLVAGHYASMNWARFANDPRLSRPLRLDNPASFGGWFSAMFAMLSAGVGVLIYQLRRYRSDDYRGQYRIWRPVIAILVILSIDSVAGVLDWTGSVIDLLLAGKAPMAGGDWIRLALCVFGFGYTARLVMEMRRCPAAATWLLVGATAVSSRLLIRWGIVEPSPLVSAMVFGSAPLVGRAAVLLSMLTFLRMVYREVRGLDVSGESVRFQLPRFGRHRERIDVEEDEPNAKPKRRPKDELEKYVEQPTNRNWFGRAKRDEEDADDGPKRKRGWFAGRGSDAEESDKDLDQPDSKRGWFGRRKETEDGVADDDDVDEAPAEKRGWFSKRRKQSDHDEPGDMVNEDSEIEEPKKKGWFSRRKASESDPSEDPKEEIEEEPVPKKRGLGGWLKGRKAPEDAGDSEPESISAGQTQQAEGSGDDEEIDFDNLDWASMSKSERRRMKKLLRRQGKDAA